MSPKVTNAYKKQKKQQILDSAKEAFKQNGYELTTMKDIVDKSGLSRGGVYLYFSNTEEIFLALLEKNDTHYISTLHYLNEQCSSKWEAIVRLAEVIKNELFCARDGMAPVIYEYFLSSKRNDRVQSLLNERYNSSLDSLTLLIKTGVDKGEFHPLFPPEEISKFILSFMDGLEVSIIHHGPAAIDLESQIKQLLIYLKYVLQVETFEQSYIF